MCHKALYRHSVASAGFIATTFAAGDQALLQVAEAALEKVHRCNIMVNDLHRHNIVVVPAIDMARVFFIDFSHSILSPSLSQCEDELCSLRTVFSQLV